MEDEKARSVTQTDAGVTVKASPFNEIKLELGVILLISVVVLLLVEGFVDDLATQLLILLAAGLAAMAWLVIRIKRVSREIISNDDGESGGQR